MGTNTREVAEEKNKDLVLRIHLNHLRKVRNIESACAANYIQSKHYREIGHVICYK